VTLRVVWDHAPLSHPRRMIINDYASLSSSGVDLKLSRVANAAADWVRMVSNTPLPEFRDISRCTKPSGDTVMFAPSKAPAVAI
jgi:hypothetical protein